MRVSKRHLRKLANQAANTCGKSAWQQAVDHHTHYMHYPQLSSPHHQVHPSLSAVCYYRSWNASSVRRMREGSAFVRREFRLRSSELWISTLMHNLRRLKAPYPQLSSPHHGVLPSLPAVCYHRSWRASSARRMREGSAFARSAVACLQTASRCASKAW